VETVVNSSAHPSSVLVVDDDRLLVDTLAVWLEDEGFEVRRAYDGLQGLASANRTSPDLVLADVLMPGLNGLNLASRLRERGVPVVLLSSVDPPSEMLPDTPFLAKPFDIADIYDVIVKTLAEHGHCTTIARQH
jgi:DNA-binding response OmpR family regulator